MGGHPETVFIVEDDDAVRNMLILLVESVGYAAQAFASAQQFLDSYTPQLSGCLLLDVRLPGLTGIGLQKRLNELVSILPIIFITAHGDIEMAVEAMKQGAMDFVEKPFREQKLLDKIAAAVERDRQNRRDLNARQTIIDRMQALTAREHEVMERVVAGQANKVIAIELGIAASTVEIHRARVMAKMQAQNLAHLVRIVLLLRQ